MFNHQPDKLSDSPWRAEATTLKDSWDVGAPPFPMTRFAQLYNDPDEALRKSLSLRFCGGSADVACR